MEAIVTRLPKGEVYYFATLGEDDWEVCWSFETGSSTDDRYFKFHNYFHTEEEAEELANKLRAVLAGADVIKTPSEEEIKERLNMIMPTNPVEPFCVEGYCKHIYDWFKSKIVK